MGLDQVPAHRVEAGEERGIVPMKGSSSGLDANKAEGEQEGTRSNPTEAAAGCQDCRQLQDLLGAWPPHLPNVQEHEERLLLASPLP